MFRITQYLKEVKEPTLIGPKRNPPGPVVIWNLIRRCNLACKHCYTNSTDKDFTGELSTDEVFHTMDDLKAFRVPVLILSGGEPLLRPDIFTIAERAKKMGFYVGLSSNGTKITQDNIDQIADVGFDYVGVSLDGIGEVHDRFRRKEGAFEEAKRGIALCKEKGIKVGLRFTLTQDNYSHLLPMLQFLRAWDLDKFYMSHLNYSGRGNVNRKDDAHYEMTRDAMELLFAEAWRYVQAGVHREFVTGNNDADGVYLLHWVRKHFPESENHIQAKLEQWGGNSTGVNIANIDNLGNVHPDSFWWDYSLGNVRERKFSEIWTDVSDPLMAGLKASPRKIGGRCGKCEYFTICGGNTRVRAWQMSKDFWAEDPGCYLTDAEIRKPMPASIREGLQTVGTGKGGSKSCTIELAETIARDYQSEKITPVSAAAFFTALYMKKPSGDEQALVNLFPPRAFENASVLVKSLAPDARQEEQTLAAEVMDGKQLTQAEARDLGRYLFSREPSDSLRAVFASALRMRHTEAVEYAGLLEALDESIEPAYRGVAPEGSPLVQIAEPFDGMERGYLLTPLLAEQFRRKGFRVVNVVGRSSGPKFGMNLQDLLRTLEAKVLKNSADFSAETPRYGWVVRQDQLSHAMDRWVDLRSQTLKRPFLATLEKFPNPWRAKIFVGSAFHHGFTDKMVETAELSGFDQVLITFRGAEGSLGLSPSRTAQVHVSIRQSDGTYIRQKHEFKASDFGLPQEAETAFVPDALTNAELIQKYLDQGTSGDVAFDRRAQFTLGVYERLGF